MSAVHEHRAGAIRNMNVAADRLHAKSEELREAIDAFDECLRLLAASGACDQLTYTPLDTRLREIRAKRNAMECFELQVRTRRVTEKAWQELP